MIIPCFMKTSVRTLLFMLLMELVSCSGNQGAKALLKRVDSLMEENPEAALALLDSAEVASYVYPHGQKMRYEMLRAKAMNKAYVDFTSDSIMKEVVEYYDAHGTANEKVEAHYLLGCVYRDLHESPAALNCYYDAVECADTLSEDCDYGMLMRVYGQMAQLYDYQIMPFEEIEALKKMQKYAVSDGDTLNYIRVFTLLANPYHLLNDSVNAINNIETAVSLYNEIGLQDAAASTLPIAIYMHLYGGNYTKAHQLMTIYETQSGLFSSDGTVAKGKEHYYHSKGYYYYAIGKLDSSIYYYNKLLKYGFKYDAHKGLAQVYNKMGDADSALQHTLLFESAFDDKATQDHSHAMYQAKGMYDYIRNEKIATTQSIEASKNRNLLYTTIIISILLSSFIFVKWRQYKHNKQNEIIQLSQELNKTFCAYEVSLREMKLQEKDYELWRSQKEKDIQTLKNKFEQLRSEFQTLTFQEKRTIQKNLPIILKLKKLATNPIKYGHLTSQDLDDLLSATQLYTPRLYVAITDALSNNDQELLVANLTTYSFTPSEIANLLSVSPQRVSNLKAIVNTKLFSDPSARTLEENIMKMLHN